MEQVNQRAFENHIETYFCFILQMLLYFAFHVQNRESPKIREKKDPTLPLMSPNKTSNTRNGLDILE